MVEFTNSRNNATRNSDAKLNGAKDRARQYRKLAVLGAVSKGIINELYSPIDATNRFINLALQCIGENSQGRQFLLESKHGIRKTSNLLKRLNIYVERIDKEICEISKGNGQGPRLSP